jgi:type IV pilus assembly protein PilF
MKIRLLYGPLFVVLILGLMSCSANRELQKKQSKAKRNLGEGYYGKGDYSSALREFLEAEALYPDDPYLHYDLGLTYKAKRRFDLAVKHFEKSIELNPKYSSAKNALGTVYLEKEEWDRAILYFKEVLSDLLYVTPHYPLSNLGWAYFNKKEYATAEKYYKDALAVDPKFIHALLGLAKTYAAMGGERLPKAVATLESAVQQYPDSSQLYLELAKAYTVLREYKRAIDAFETAATLAPDSPLAAEAKKEIQRLRNLW